MTEPINRSFGKYLRTCSDKSFQRSFTCGAPKNSPEYLQAYREYDRASLLYAWSQLFYHFGDEIEEELS